MPLWASNVVVLGLGVWAIIGSASRGWRAWATVVSIAVFYLSFSLICDHFTP